MNYQAVHHLFDKSGQMLVVDKALLAEYIWSLGDREAKSNDNGDG
jgi:hypothetical protein